MMIAIICVDDNLGMMFNNRRQSQDKILRKRILEISTNSRLLMNSYSIKQFDEEDRDKIITDEDFAKNAQKGDIETQPVRHPGQLHPRAVVAVLLRLQREDGGRALQGQEALGQAGIRR